MAASLKKYSWEIPNRFNFNYSIFARSLCKIKDFSAISEMKTE